MSDELRAWGTIGMPAGISMVYTDFASAIAGLVAATQVYAMRTSGGTRMVEIASANTCYVSKARNDLVRSAQGDWLFQTDTDHAFEMDLLVRLLQTMYGPVERGEADGPMPVVSGLYFARRSHLPQVYMWKDETEWTEAGIMRPAATFPRDEPFKADCVGAGALLVQRSVFAHITEQLGREPFAPVELTDGAGRPITVEDDVAFCHNCALLGIPIVVEPRALSYHIDATHLGWDEFDRAIESHALVEAGR